MSTTPPPDCQITSQLRSLRSELRFEQIKIAMDVGMVAGELRSLRDLVHQYLLTHPGPPSSSGPTPGAPPSPPSSDLMKRVRDLGGLVARGIRLANLMRNVWGFWTLVAPMILLAAGTVWKLAAPWLQWAWRLAAGW